MPGLKAGVENDIFWSEIGSGFEEPGGTPQPRIPRRLVPTPGQLTAHFTEISLATGQTVMPSVTAK